MSSCSGSSRLEQVQHSTDANCPLGPSLSLPLRTISAPRAHTLLPAQALPSPPFRTAHNCLPPCTHSPRTQVLVKGEPNISYICSRYYRAPELIFGATDYSAAIDVWSVGCVMAELLLGQPLFPGESGVDQLVEIIKVGAGRRGGWVSWCGPMQAPLLG